MTTTKHAPEPWYSRRINALLAKVDDEAERLSGFRRAEAAALALTDTEREELAFLRNYEDNRALYEAAPNLLAALEEVREGLRCYSHRLNGIVGQDSPYRDCECWSCRNARTTDAAIAKAKGA